MVGTGWVILFFFIGIFIAGILSVASKQAKPAVVVAIDVLCLFGGLYTIYSANLYAKYSEIDWHINGHYYILQNRNEIALSHAITRLHFLKQEYESGRSYHFPKNERESHREQSKDLIGWFREVIRTLSSDPTKDQGWRGILRDYNYNKDKFHDDIKYDKENITKWLNEMEKEIIKVEKLEKTKNNIASKNMIKIHFAPLILAILIAIRFSFNGLNYLFKRFEIGTDRGRS